MVDDSAPWVVTFSFLFMLSRAAVENLEGWLLPGLHSEKGFCGLVLAKAKLLF
jgi:hypothetical protein